MIFKGSILLPRIPIKCLKNYIFGTVTEREHAWKEEEYRLNNTILQGIDH
jgi:hypothetical protein